MCLQNDAGGVIPELAFTRIPKVGRERRALKLSSGKIRFAVAPQAQISSLPRASLLRGYRHACGSERFEFGIELIERDATLSWLAITSRQRRDPSARRDPLVVSLKFQPGLVVKDPQVAVPTAHDRLRDNPLHLLRDNSDIGFFASIINEAIEANAIVETAEQADLVLKPKIGSPSAATATTSKAASAAVTALPPWKPPLAATAAVKPPPRRYTPPRWYTPPVRHRDIRHRGRRRRGRRRRGRAAR